MSNEKQSTKTNHFLNKKKKKLKIFYRVTITAILIATSYFFYNAFIKNPYMPFFEVFNISNEIEEAEEPEIFAPINTKTNFIIKKANYLEITGIYINSDNPELSTVAAKLKNNSAQSYENVNLRITLFDKDNLEITSLDYKIEQIEANGESSTFAALARDLSDCTSFQVNLVETTEQQP